MKKPNILCKSVDLRAAVRYHRNLKDSDVAVPPREFWSLGRYRQAKRRNTQKETLMREYTRQMPATVISIVAMLPLAAAQAQLSYTANPYASNATGSVSDHVTDPIIGPTTHEYSKTTGDLVWGYDYINLLDPDEDIFINGWARFSLDGLPADATIESATVSLYAYGYFQPGALGDPMVVTALFINPMTASAQTLYNATTNGTVLSAPAGNLLEMEGPAQRQWPGSSPECDFSGLGCSGLQVRRFARGDRPGGTSAMVLITTTAGEMAQDRDHV